MAIMHLMLRDDMAQGNPSGGRKTYSYSQESLPKYIYRFLMIHFNLRYVTTMFSDNEGLGLLKDTLDILYNLEWW